MQRIRVLIVDGVSTTRQLLGRVLQRDMDLEVVAAVAGGRLALARLSELRPDVVLLDVALPELEGLQTLAAVRETHPHLPVIVFSGLTERGSQVTVEALLLGATDYVTKPVSNAELEQCVLGELTMKIKSLHAASVKCEPEGVSPMALTLESSRHIPCAVSLRSADGTWSVPATPPVKSVSSGSPVAVRPATPSAEIVAIATSTGGPNALTSLLSSLPATFTTPIVVVQHMAAGFTSTLAASLRRQTGRDVREVETVQPLNAAPVWLAPGGRHLVVTRQGATIQVAPDNALPENGCCPSADVLFRSVVDLFGSRCLAVVLTGMGHDGLAGCRAIRHAGGQILAQDEATSIAWGMPGQVAMAGLADDVLPLTGIAQEICRRTTHTRTGRTGDP